MTPDYCTSTNISIMTSKHLGYTSSASLTPFSDDEVDFLQLHSLGTAQALKETSKRVHWASGVIDNEKHSGEMTSQQRLLIKRNRAFVQPMRTLTHSVTGRNLTMKDYEGRQKKSTKKNLSQSTELFSGDYSPDMDPNLPTRYRREVQNRSSKAKAATQKINTMLSRTAELDSKYHVKSLPPLSHRTLEPPPAPRPPRLPTPELSPLPGNGFCNCCDDVFNSYEPECCSAQVNEIAIGGSCGCPDAHWGEHNESCKKQRRATRKMRSHLAAAAEYIAASKSTKSLPLLEYPSRDIIYL
ncbi:hypothetical protein F5884DRAFT_324610 [Xylogone sp. PMI_703]|nr:hypothetical protein F5884DRAFT_324610 [Xylogone sp. PMI_703]